MPHSPPLAKRTSKMKAVGCHAARIRRAIIASRMKRAGTAAVALVLTGEILSLGACGRKKERPRDIRLLVLTTFVPFEIDPYKDTRHRSRDVFANVFEPLIRRDAAGELL